MGIFDFHKPKDIRYVSKEALKANLQKQDEALANILGVIKKNSLTDTNQRCLEYFFIRILTKKQNYWQRSYRKRNIPLPIENLVIKKINSS